MEGERTGLIREIQYRGSLKSCNYACSYCPFAKRRAGREQLERDREALRRFVKSLEKLAGELAGKEKGGPEKSGGREVFNSGLGVLIVPYGEALIHGYYWQEMAALSRLAPVQAVGAQTNLSFRPEECLRLFSDSGGKVGKLCLWATFHPEMEQEEVFAEKCRFLLRKGVRLCAGAVGKPDCLPAIRRLRELLPGEMYLWINRMDGLGRPYTEEEIREFLKLDPWFLRELHRPKADPSLCRTRLFVEADGGIRRCNLSEPSGGNWYAGEAAGPFFLPPLPCKRKRCSCYLAASGRSDFPGRAWFGPFSQFRIPQNPKAWFFDVDGTLAEEGEEVGEEMAYRLQNLTGKIFLATSLPLSDARKRCRRIWELLDGGIFYAGALVAAGRGDGREEYVFPLSPKGCAASERWAKERGLSYRLYRHKGVPVKAVAFLPGKGRVGFDSLSAAQYPALPSGDPDKRPAQAEGGPAAGNLLDEGRLPGGVRCFEEAGCVQFVSEKADKRNGAALLCRLFGLKPEDCGAAGDSGEDAALLSFCGLGLSPGQLKEGLLALSFQPPAGQ